MSFETGDLRNRIDTIWLEDRLGRKQDAAMVYTFLNGQLALRENAGLARTFVLNLDSDWGSGKSFFLTRFQEELTARGHVAVYVNAWEDDHSDDPFLSVVTAVQAGLTSKLDLEDEDIVAKARPFLRTIGKLALTAVVGGGKQFAKRLIGREGVEELGALLGNAEDTDTLADDVEAGAGKALDTVLDSVGSKLLNGFEHHKAARGAFRSELEGLAKTVCAQDGIEAPVFVLIDELDRCRPAYAVELLERVKHLFSVEDFVFVLGSDTEQLSHAIRGLYGGDFDEMRYLKRFIDRTYKFQPVEMEAFVTYAFERLGLEEGMFTLPPQVTAVGFLEKMFSARGIELRDIEQMIEVIATFAAVWPWKGVPINLVALLPLVHEQHLNLPLGAKYDPPMMKQELLFSKLGGQLFISIPLEQMVDALRRRSAKTNRPSDPTNTFLDWVINVVNGARRDMKTDDPQGYDNPYAEYHRILATVANLQDDPPNN